MNVEREIQRLMRKYDRAELRRAKWDRGMEAIQKLIEQARKLMIECRTPRKEERRANRTWTARQLSAQTRKADDRFERLIHMLHKQGAAR